MAEQTELERLRCGAAELGVELTDRAGENLIAYVHLVQRWNQKFNLVSRQDASRLLSRHVLDSLSVCRWLHGERVLDIGSGAGLPGIPLAIANAERDFVLTDRSERKARFLDYVVMTFELANVEVRCVDVRDLAAGNRFDTVVCRAVAGLEEMWPMAGPLLAEGGRLLFMNRTGVEIDPDTRDVGRPAGTSIVTEHVQIPGLSASHEVLIVEARA
ncbi:MAG: 16S rRNA (guanine(527)-N(7))-methyltransferase RsmG [Gammaproteobacteria bacterium]|nr:16S rRNA (guanine(527)-N(7))-methyltransferase RsmG [Gammaproteobacteria bacterium]